ncbi:hypothetical protein AAH979_12525 [Plantactinospora sp. ZYX-F-223]|uniref:hypothetical protein n=1 Tax=Plantactinospora sp. ZYX-F-223 TaxID=3144103 RepID=UPI0031FBFA6A
MQSGMHRYRLSVGFHGSRAIRVVFMVFLGGMAAGAAICAGTLLGLVGIAILAPGDPSGPERWGFLPIVLAVLASGAVVAYTAVRITRVVRTDAWLEGSRLTVRVVRERTVELSYATSVAVRVTNRPLIGPVRRAGVVGPAPMMAVLVVTGEGRTVHLRLANPDAIQLPPDQLFALANALSVARCPGAVETVTWLRGAAANASAG